MAVVDRRFHGPPLVRVTRILSNRQGDPQAAEKLLPLVYEELRKLAAAKLAQENPGQTLQATALVHEAYIRLVGGDGVEKWDNRGHFFAAAAEAMRRILIEAARRKARVKWGGELQRLSLDEVAVDMNSDPDDYSPSTMLWTDCMRGTLRRLSW
jgi:RNA polymerase sigma factor (TIGR02999 family)